MILDYDYTFTTPYCGSGVVEKDQETVSVTLMLPNVLHSSSPFDVLFFLLLQVVLYEDELAANGVSLLTVKVVKKSQVFLSSSIFFNNAFDLIQVVC